MIHKPFITNIYWLTVPICMSICQFWSCVFSIHSMSTTVGILFIFSFCFSGMLCYSFLSTKWECMFFFTAPPIAKQRLISRKTIYWQTDTTMGYSSLCLTLLYWSSIAYIFKKIFFHSLTHYKKMKLCIYLETSLKFQHALLNCD